MQSSAVPLINSKIQRFGEVKALEIDSRSRRMRLELVLKGEVSPVSVEIGTYQVFEQDGKTYISARDFAASREWLTVALNEFLTDRKIELPSAVKLLL